MHRSAISVLPLLNPLTDPTFPTTNAFSPSNGPTQGGIHVTICTLLCARLRRVHRVSVCNAAGFFFGSAGTVQLKSSGTFYPCTVVPGTWTPTSVVIVLPPFNWFGAAVGFQLMRLPDGALGSVFGFAVDRERPATRA